MPPDASDAKLRWEDGDVPVSERFDDPYYSRTDGLAESRHVFLDGNDLEARFRAATGRFHIAELGFGTGLNMLATIALWRKMSPAAQLRFTSFEACPLGREDMARALAQWPELSHVAEELLAGWPTSRIDLSGVELEVIEGDVATTLPRWKGRTDAWFLDGFAPSRNPEMWSPAVLQAVAEGTVRNGTFATYTAAGFVRRGLQAAGFEVLKRPGFGSKREMLTGRKI